MNAITEFCWQFIKMSGAVSLAAAIVIIGAVILLFGVAALIDVFTAIFRKSR